MEAAENAVEAYQITGAAKVAETLEAAKVAARITVEAANEPAVNVEAVVEKLLRDIFASAQIDPESNKKQI